MLDMGGQVSIEAFDPTHVRIYTNILNIKNPQIRAQMIQTCMAGTEYIHAAKRSGVYSYLLGYVSAVQSGHQPRSLPGESAEITQISNSSNSSNSGNSGNSGNTIHNIPRSIGADNMSIRPSMQLTSYKEGPAWKQLTMTREKKAVTYFASCLEVLGIQEEVTLTEAIIKKAYKKISIKAHPDKGGSEAHFEAITRAYAYLTEIIRRMQGGRDRAPGVVDAPEILDTGRKEEAQAWKHVEPVRLNAKNLDMNTFNKMFESTHIPDPDNDGYGDWLKTAGEKEAPKFGGKFNRDVFNSMFDDDARKRAVAGGNKQSALTLHPDAMAMLPTMGVELGRDRPDTYTAAPNSRQQYTDLRAAYTTESTFSGNVSNVRVEDRKFETYRANRESAPAPLSGDELSALRSSEQEMLRREDMRQRRKAERDVVENSYFERMKQLVVTDGK